MNELFCEKHGPYDASLGKCPYCSGGGRQPYDPGSLDDDVSTDPRMAFSPKGYSDNDETILPGQGRSGGYDSSGDTTEPPIHGKRGSINEDDTQLPERIAKKRILDEGYDDELDDTVLERPDHVGLMGWLIVKKSQHMRRGTILKVRPGGIFGRSPKKADFVVDDEKVSSLHARIQLKDNQFVIIDMGSSNGTWVNDIEIQGPTTLKQDDEIKLGDAIFVLKTL